MHIYDIYENQFDIRSKYLFITIHSRIAQTILKCLNSDIIKSLKCMTPNHKIFKHNKILRSSLYLLNLIANKIVVDVQRVITKICRAWARVQKCILYCESHLKYKTSFLTQKWLMQNRLRYLRSMVIAIQHQNMLFNQMFPLNKDLT